MLEISTCSAALVFILKTGGENRNHPPPKAVQKLCVVIFNPCNHGEGLGKSRALGQAAARALLLARVLLHGARRPPVQSCYLEAVFHPKSSC